MTRWLSQLWSWRGTVGRRDYILWGLGLMVLKYNLDRIVAAHFGHPGWFWLNYWQPRAGMELLAPAQQTRLFVALLLLALPFIAVGLMLTLRRLRDVGWPLGWVVVFFLPAFNLLFFVILAATPGRRAHAGSTAMPVESKGRRYVYRFGLDRPLVSAALAILATALLAVPVVAIGTMYLQNYGWGVFVALPFCLGLVAAVLHGYATPRRWRSCVAVALLALALCGAAIVALAVEGIICVLMAAPITAPLTLLGATAGYYLQLARWNRPPLPRVYTTAWLLLPAVLVIEPAVIGPPAEYAVTTSVDIAAPPSQVWRHVVTFSELPPPDELVFRSGIAYPIRARISGHGVGAVRYCEFSTGPFVEPITTWEEPWHLAFTVARQPHPMKEVSPYRALPTAHLEGFFRSRRGEFRLESLPGERTRLVGTTWYTQRFWPATYWKTWSDWLVHTIHRRVLMHIKAEAEDTRGNPDGVL